MVTNLLDWCMMSTKLNENQRIAVHLIASGVKASNISKQIGIREETLSRWRQEDIFKEALEDTTEIILREIVDTHKNILIKCQNIILDTLNDKNLDMLKKANIALRYLSLIRGKGDISQKSSETLKEHLDDKEFKFGII